MKIGPNFLNPKIYFVYRQIGIKPELHIPYNYQHTVVGMELVITERK
jgi:hypothetical protein